MNSLCTYTPEEIDQWNTGESTLPKLPKFEILTAFLQQESETSQPHISYHSRGGRSRPRGLERHRFGAGGKHVSIFKQDTSFDGQLKCKVNELNSKITEHNVETILQEFKTLEFDKVREISPIVRLLHRSLLICAKYGDQILELFNFLLETYPNYTSPLQREFLEFSKNQLGQLLTNNETNDNLEERFIIRQSIMRNYELMFKCFKMGLVFTEPRDTIKEIGDYLLSQEHLETFEMFIRFLVLQKTYGWPIPGDLVAELEKTVKDRRYPKRLDFLIMDLE